MAIQSLECPNCSAPLPDPAGRATVVCSHCHSTIQVAPTVIAPPPAAGLTAADQAEIERLLAAGRKIEAIKLYRERTKSGLAEAKTAVEAIESRLKSSPRPVASAMTAAPGLAAEDNARIMQLLRDRKRIDAIKLYQERTGSDLTESMRMIDQMQNTLERVATHTHAGVNLTRIQETLRRGNRILAIQEYRAMTGKPLKEATEAVDAIAAATPGVPAAARPHVASGGCAGIAGAILVFVLLICGGCGAYIQTSGVYRCPMNVIRANNDVQALLGEPVSGGYPVVSLGFEQSTSFDGLSETSAEYVAPVWGPEGRALLLVRAHQYPDTDVTFMARLFNDWQWQTIATWTTLPCP